VLPSVVLGAVFFVAKHVSGLGEMLGDVGPAHAPEERLGPRVVDVAPSVRLGVEVTEPHAADPCALGHVVQLAVVAPADERDVDDGHRLVSVALPPAVLAELRALAVAELADQAPQEHGLARADRADRTAGELEQVPVDEARRGGAHRARDARAPQCGGPSVTTTP